MKYEKYILYFFWNIQMVYGGGELKNNSCKTKDMHHALSYLDSNLSGQNVIF